MTWRY